MRRDLDALREDVRALAFTLRETQNEQRHDRDIAARARENLVLRLETYLLRLERGLLPPSSPGEPPL